MQSFDRKTKAFLRLIGLDIEHLLDVRRAERMTAIISNSSPSLLVTLSDLRMVNPGINRIIVPPLSRRSIARMCEDGTFETAPRPNPRSQYYIYEDSFLAWVKGLEQGTGR